MNKRRVKRKIIKKITITLIIVFTILIGAVAAMFFQYRQFISQEPTEEELLEQEN